MEGRHRARYGERGAKPNALRVLCLAAPPNVQQSGSSCIPILWVLERCHYISIID